MKLFWLPAKRIATLKSFKIGAMHPIRVQWVFKVKYHQKELF